jgi:DNA-binding beta-propeller fold protein YncE
MAVVVIVGTLALLAGCARVTPSTKPSAPIFFPPPPQKAHVQYLGSVFSQRDLPSQRTRWADFILGEQAIQYPLVKPISATMAGPRLYVCDTIVNRVVIYDLVQGGVHVLAGDHGTGKIQEPNSVTVGPDGNIYVADKKRQAVLVYGPDEEFLHAWGRPEQVEPVAVAVTDKVLYVCDIKDFEIEVWDAKTGDYLRSFGSKGPDPGQFNYPTQVALDSQGNVYVTDTGNFRVQKFSPEGKLMQQFGGYGDELGHFAWPKGMDVDAHGRLFVADARFCNVQIFDPQGQLLLFFGGPDSESGYLSLPAGLKILPWPADIPWLNERVAPGFHPEELLLVVSQSGAVSINFFAVARDESEEP